MAGDATVQEFLDLADKYLFSARLSKLEELWEPALANGIHALELACKAALTAKGLDLVKTHNVGGLMGREFRAHVEEKKCRQLNRLFMKYHFPRYPGSVPIFSDEVEEALAFI